MVAMESTHSEVCIDMSWLEDSDHKAPALSYPEPSGEKPSDEIDHCIIRLDEHDDRFSEVEKWASTNTAYTNQLTQAVQRLASQNKRSNNRLEHVEAQSRDANDSFDRVKHIVYINTGLLTLLSFVVITGSLAELP